MSCLRLFYFCGDNPCSKYPLTLMDSDTNLYNWLVNYNYHIVRLFLTTSKHSWFRKLQGNYSKPQDSHSLHLRLILKSRHLVALLPRHLEAVWTETRLPQGAKIKNAVFSRFEMFWAFRMKWSILSIFPWVLQLLWICGRQPQEGPHQHRSVGPPAHLASTREPFPDSPLSPQFPFTARIKSTSSWKAVWIQEISASQRWLWWSWHHPWTTDLVLPVRNPPNTLSLRCCAMSLSGRCTIQRYTLAAKT